MDGPPEKSLSISVKISSSHGSAMNFLGSFSHDELITVLANGLQLVTRDLLKKLGPSYQNSRVRTCFAFNSVVTGHPSSMTVEVTSIVIPSESSTS